MKRICALVLINAWAIFEIANGQQQESGGPVYSNRWNNLNVDTILGSNRLVTNYVECLLSRKPCPPEGKDLKRILPEALKTKCARCSTHQREGALKVITKLYYDYPQHYNRLRAKWDPTGEYHRRFEEYLRGLQFNIISNEPAAAASNNGNGIGPSYVAAQTPSYVPVNQPPSVPVNNQNFVTSTLPTTRQATFNIDTQRPARNPSNAQNSNSPTPSTVAPTVDVYNRFGGGDDLASSGASPSVVTSTVRAMPTIAAVPTQRTLQTAAVTAPVTMRKTTEAHPTGRPAIIIDKYFVAQTTPYRPSSNPLVGLINTIGFKITNTADFIAGMLRGTIQQT